MTGSGKKKEGGIVLYVIKRWCNPGHIHVKEHLCSGDMELMAFGLRPYFLWEEFTFAIVITAYITPFS